ncbi:leucine-rich repeat domain-containing protein [Candidatus Saccharibacteria bacterium]|nr:leucine-rich repeat domain-containing protein [Candidatus Saccharibacteria bacterium]
MRRKEFLYLGHLDLVAVPKKAFKNASVIIELMLNYNQITQLPPKIKLLVKLRVLLLNNNLLRSLPNEFAQLTTLQSLQLQCNAFDEVPSVIRSLVNLEKLHMGHNKIKEIPPWLGELTNLQHLDMQDNEITTVPEEIGNLIQLRHLSLQDNKIRSLPSVVGNLYLLETLEIDEPMILCSELGMPRHLDNLHRHNALETMFYFWSPKCINVSELTNLTRIKYRHVAITEQPFLEPQRKRRRRMTLLDLEAAILLRPD